VFLMVLTASLASIVVVLIIAGELGRRARLSAVKSAQD